MRHDLRRTSRSGLTLIEVMIALAILAIAAAIIYPNVFRTSAPSVLGEAQIIEQARALAVARAEPVRLTVERGGAWEIVAESAPASVLASGQLPEAPAGSYAVRVSELGACLPVAGNQAVEGAVIDAVSCTVRP